MRLAITGGAGEGKSTVLQMLAEQGIPVLSADEIARRVYDRPETQAFLADLLCLPAPLNRDAVRAALGDAAARRALNAYMHPIIWSEFRGHDRVAVEVPLLIETCLQGRFDRVWVVTCGLAEQRRRLLLRLGDEAVADQFLRAQLPTRAKEAFADRVIRTNCEISLVHRSVIQAAAEDFA